MISAQKNSMKKRESISIREMEFEDIYQVFQLGEKLFTSEDLPNLYRTWDEHEVIAFFQEDQETCLVAVRGKRIVGFVLGTTVLKSRSAWKYGYLVWLGVNPTYQREGVATRLFNQFRNLMLENGVRMLLVDTEVANEEAFKFFQRAGFGNPEEHVYMTLNLAAEQKQRKEELEGQSAKSRKSTNNNHDR